MEFSGESPTISTCWRRINFEPGALPSRALGEKSASQAVGASAVAIDMCGRRMRHQRHLCVPEVCRSLPRATDSENIPEFTTLLGCQTMTPPDSPPRMSASIRRSAYA